MLSCRTSQSLEHTAMIWDILKAGWSVASPNIFAHRPSFYRAPAHLLLGTRGWLRGPQLLESPGNFVKRQAVWLHPGVSDSVGVGGDVGQGTALCGSRSKVVSEGPPGLGKPELLYTVSAAGDALLLYPSAQPAQSDLSLQVSGSVLTGSTHCASHWRGTWPLSLPWRLVQLSRPASSAAVCGLTFRICPQRVSLS